MVIRPTVCILMWKCLKLLVGRLGRHPSCKKILR